MKRFEHADTSDLRTVCIENNFYTCGNCEEYDNMFAMFESWNEAKTESQKMQILQDVAEDILEHSSDEKIDEGWNVESVSWVIFEKAITVFFER